MVFLPFVRVPNRVSELDEVTEARNKARTAEDLRRLRLEKIMEGFGHITLKLKEMYQMITLGGDAELELVDSLDPLSEGVVFSVRRQRNRGKISQIFLVEKRRFHLWLLFSHYIITNQRHCMSWTKLMQHLTSGTSLL